MNRAHLNHRARAATQPSPPDTMDLALELPKTVVVRRVARRIGILIQNLDLLASTRAVEP